MPAMSLICSEFVKSLLIPADSASRHSAATGGDAALTNGGGAINGNGLSHADSDEDVDVEVVGAEVSEVTRKTLLEQNEKLEELPSGGDADQQALDNRLKVVAALRTKLRL